MKIKDHLSNKQVSQDLAVVDGNVSLTYQELYQKATLLALHRYTHTLHMWESAPYY